MPKLLLIDNDRATLQMLRHAFRDDSLEIVTATNLAQALERSESIPDVALVDLVLPGGTGLEAVHRLHQGDADLPVIVMAAHGTSETAIEAIKSGAFDYLLKPLDPNTVKGAVNRALRVRRAVALAEELPIAEVSSGTTLEARVPLVGRSPPMQEVFKAVGRVAPQTVTVLIQGESGTGKELIARAIHDHSPRGAHVFLAVNCAAIPELLLESELFGHEQGAFTSADERRIGKFEQCSGGTIFLDEIGDMSPLVQGKVLRVLQEQRFERVGGGQTIETDVRILCATNRDLQQMVAQGAFREDLYYRLNGFSIRLPPLRERGDDVSLLLAHCLRKLANELGKPVHAISSDAHNLLTGYAWPGNVRELEAVMRQALLQTTGTVLLPEFLPDVICGDASQTSPSNFAVPLQSDLAPLVERQLRRKDRHIYAEALTLMERYVLTRVLRHSRGNQSEAARLLGITRGCLRSRIRALGITFGARVSAEDDAA
jgi:two-component system nitrogen regulation response regulator GlnG